MCVGQRGGGQSISYIKAHGTQCSEESAGKYDRNDDTRLHCIIHTAVQLRATSAAGLKAQWPRAAAAALHTHRFCTTHLRGETGVRIHFGFRFIIQCSSTKCNLIQKQQSSNVASYILKEFN